LLVGAFVVRQLPPWFENAGKREVKSPKVYARDSGLLHALLNLPGRATLESHPKLGTSWEGFALEQVLNWAGERNAYFWATHGGAELDLLVMRNGERWGFEFKCQDAPKMTRSMHIALEDLKLERLWVIHPGPLPAARARGMPRPARSGADAGDHPMSRSGWMGGSAISASNSGRISSQSRNDNGPFPGVTTYEPPLMDKSSVLPCFVSHSSQSRNVVVMQTPNHTASTRETCSASGQSMMSLPVVGSVREWLGMARFSCARPRNAASPRDTPAP
jgi:hypothetical protein